MGGRWAAATAATAVAAGGPMGGGYGGMGGGFGGGGGGDIRPELDVPGLRRQRLRVRDELLPV